jgi:hypothetical protein
MPSLVKGNNVYRPSQGTYGAASATLQLAKDADKVPALTDSPISDGANFNEGCSGHVGPGDDAEEETPPVPPPSSLPSSPVSPPLSLTPQTAVSDIVPDSDTSMSCATPSTSTGSKRKRSALSAAQSSSTSNKRQHTTPGTITMNGIKESIEKFNATISNSVLMQPDRLHADTSPERRAKAVDLIQVQEDYLSDDQMVAFLDFFRADTAAADIYLAIKRESLRKAWVQKQLWKELGFPQAAQ